MTKFQFGDKKYTFNDLAIAFIYGIYFVLIILTLIDLI